MEAQDASPYRLTEEQLAELRRRRAKRNPKYMSLAEAKKRVDTITFVSPYRFAKEASCLTS